MAVMDKFHAEDTPINLAIHEMFKLLQHNIGATCEPQQFNALEAKIYEIMNDNDRFILKALMDALTNSLYVATQISGFTYEHVLNEINNNIRKVKHKKPFFTREQEDWICYQIGEWYLEWKNCIAKGEHQLGYAKEKLKLRLCTEDKDNE
jgi:hypothetical protein